jgi:hypothetical protein
MPKRLLQLATILFLAATLNAQNSAPPSGSAPAGRQEPCWKQAGISQTVFAQHQQIEHDARSQIATVCENSSLAPQQKQEQVKEIRRQSEQKKDALITPAQQTTLHACQQQRWGNRENHPMGGGGCGNFAQHRGQQGAANGNSGETPQQPQN